MTRWTLAALTAILACAAQPALAWNSEAHKIVALVASHYLDPGVRQRIDAILATDKAAGEDHGLGSAAAWAGENLDLLRKDDPARAKAIESWSDVGIDIDTMQVPAACGQSSTAKKEPASRGPADCALKKLAEFADELASKTASESERLLALKYVLSLVADLHQPLYAADRHDEGGRTTMVSAAGETGSLRAFWDVDTIDYLGDDPTAIADDLADGVRQSKSFEKMSAGTPRDWAVEAAGLARDHSYGKLPQKKPDGTYVLPPDYVTDAIETVRLQLARAGVRLAAMLNQRLGQPR